MESRKEKFPFPNSHFLISNSHFHFHFPFPISHFLTSNSQSHFPFSISHFPLVSIIVTTKNEEKNIANCLESIKNQSLNSRFPIPISLIEIIVVDNNSTDNTVKIAKEFTDKVYNKGPERSAQRNFGVEKAKGKYILYLDADMNLSERVIEEYINKCENEDYVALYIPEKIVGRGFWIKVRDFERSFYNATCLVRLFCCGRLGS